MSNGQKQMVLGVGVILVLWLCYQLAFSKTLEQKAQYQQLQQQELVSQNAPKQLALYKQQEQYYDSLLTKYQIDGPSLQNNLLKAINSYADTNHLKVISFLEPHRFKTNNLMVNTYEFTIEGTYNNITGLIYQLEQKTKFGEVAHLHFEKKKNYRTGKQYLQARVLLRSFEG
jgi:hypothetical protein